MVVLYACFFSAWALMSALWQFESLREKFPFPSVIWKFRALPIYTFFAPNPGIFDYRIVCRTQDTDGEVSEWLEVDHLVQRKWYHFLWNPRKRVEKLIADSVSGVKTAIVSREEDETEDEQRAAVMISQGYISLLNLAISSIPSKSKFVQFIIAETSHETEERKLFPILKSPLHVVK
mmetsp:Transcript_23535/g.41573  ORF Transcript_23535/g.41573 Transcript_23535/m.41573 type:complete len:177 (-) Transcript_23535:1568-2098(-)